MSNTHDIRRSGFFTDSKIGLRCETKQGSRGKWRWAILDEDGASRMVSPVRGWQTEEEALADARGLARLFGCTL